MIPDPLHPAIVHIPIAIAIVLPFIIIIAIYLIKPGVHHRIPWLPVVALSVFLFAGALAAKNTGESDEEAVEQVVPEQYIEAHEENAETFTLLAGLLLALSLAGLLKEKPGSYARLATGAASLILVVLSFQTGHSGGELVYTHGAASVSTAAAEGRTQEKAVSDEGADHDDDD